MKVFFDTSVLVAASVEAHPHHARALPVLHRVVENKDQGFISAHSIAETFAALTRVPVSPRIHPSEAHRIITEGILPHVQVVLVETAQYLSALQVMTHGGYAGARIYDALLLGCAHKCNAARIYTFNVNDFMMLAGDKLGARVQAP